MMLAVLPLATALLTSCQAKNEQTAGQEQSVTLLVSAAASLSNVMEELQQKFLTIAPQIKLEFNFAASGALQKQIEQGAPVDLFISAGEQQMKALQQKGFMQEDAVASLLANELVLITNKTNKHEADHSLASMLQQIDPQYIAIGEPDSVPAGQYAKQALTNELLWEQWKDHFVYAKDVRQVLSYVEQGNADVGLVYQSDALTSEEVTIVHVIDRAAHDPIIYPIGIVKETKQLQAAQQLYQFLLSDEAAQLFEQYGFQKVE